MASKVQYPVQYTDSLPSRSQFSQETVLFYDSVLTKDHKLKSWIEKFEHRVDLKSGEALKTLTSLSRILQRLELMDIPKTSELTFVALGGGSVGDFVGFLASIYWRGRKLIHIPSTWLAAVDSAHGGKNGLNVNQVKNQLGTFYPADKVMICRDLLKTQPPERLADALGEMIKMAILSDQNLFEYFEDHALGLSFDEAWSVLPRLIELKYKIINQDPFEKSGVRRLLNLGHTMGHVFESRTGWSHGFSILNGLLFATRYSYQSGLLNEKDYVRISLLFETLGVDESLRLVLKKMKNKEADLLLQKDKKQNKKSMLDFIFIRSVGQCERRSVKRSEIIKELDRQRPGF